MAEKLDHVSKKNGPKIDYILIGTTLLLLAIGLIAIYDVTIVAALRDFHDKFYYFKNQLVWACLGLIAMSFFSFFDYHKLVKIGPLAMLASFMLLVGVLIPHIGTKVYGASRWYNLGSIRFQPSEFAKLALIFYEVAIISKFEKYKVFLQDALFVVFLPAILITGLILLQPDLGTALIFLAITLVMYFASNAPISHFIISLPVLIICAIGAVILQPYRLSRFKAFLDPTFDPKGSSYQINQILIALSSGGLLGVGLGASRSKFAFIPEVQSDAIFAIIVEEVGFIGALFIILLFIVLITRSIKVAQSAKDIQGRLLATGIVALIAIQSLFNIASNVALVPLTGIPLPFISYGGSSLFITMASIGILNNIKRQS